MPVLIALLGVLGDEDGSGAQSLTLLLINSCLTFLSTSSCLGICHTEDVVGLHASIEAAVSRNGSAEFLSLVGRVLDPVEDSECVLVRLLLLASLLSVSEVHSLGLGGFLSDALGSVDSVEFVDRGGRNGL